MPLLLPVRDTDFDTLNGAQRTLEELRAWVKEIGYPEVNFKFVPGRHPSRLSLYFWETGDTKKLKIADNLRAGAMVKFLNAWWLGFRYCNYHAKANGGIPKERLMESPYSFQRKKNVAPILEEVV